MLKSKYSPHITRLFPALTSLILKTVLICLFLLIITGGIYLRLAGMTMTVPPILGVTEESTLENKDPKDTSQLEKNLGYWLEVINKKPHYRDSYIQAAWYYKQLGNYDKSKLMRSKAREIDPLY